jgi:hypothetical protein
MTEQVHEQVLERAPEHVVLTREELDALLTEACRRGARQGADEAFDKWVFYNLKDAAEFLGMSYNTLKKRIAEGKLRPVDGRLTGQELRQYTLKTTTRY